MVLPSKLFADGFQFPPAFRRGLGIGHFKFIKRIKNNLGNNQPGIFLIIGGNDVPRRVMGAGCGQAILISLHVMLPVFPLVNVSEAEFPVLVRLINAFEESLSLFVFRQMEEKFDDPGAVAVKMISPNPRWNDTGPSRWSSSSSNSSGSPWLRRISGCTRTTSTSS